MPETAEIDAEDLERAASVLPAGRVEEYLAMRHDGTSHNLALICLTRRAPGLHLPDKRMRLTDSSRMLGRKALQTGQYMDALARPEVVKKFGSDPNAYVDSKKEAHRRAERMGLQVLDRGDIENAMNADERQYLEKD